MEPIKITFPDGKIKEYPRGIKGEEILKDLPQSVRKKALAVKVNDEIYELNRPIETDAAIKFLTWEDPEGKMCFWHSSAHIMAEALESFYPGIKLAIGPPIENGFYYDIDFGEHKFTPEDFKKIEKKFLKLAASGETFVRKKVSKQEALEFYKDNPYKKEIIESLEDGDITFYYSGNFVDLCRGPHIANSKVIKAMKILNTAGAYWRGDANNPQLTRIYGISFPSKQELNDYLHFLEEAKKRDHRILGKKMDLFSFQEEAPGMPFWHHKGITVLNLLQDFLRKKLLDLEYQEIRTPLILKDTLWKQSGHYDNYKENMYFTTVEEQDYAVKPMNCPGSTIVYRTQMRSYKDLPLRLFEFGLVHRYEYSGALHGLFRVRAFTQDDAHIYCLPEQIETEIDTLIKLAFEVYDIFGFHSVDVYLSTRPEKYIGDLETWNNAENALKKALENSGIPFQINEGDGAFYGPKIDFVVKDSLNREWQLTTIQLDFSMPRRFGLYYIGADGQEHHPVMIHRAILGSFERFVGVLIEHTAGTFPFWLAPVQARILPVSDQFNDYAEKIKNVLQNLGYRVEADTRNERLGKKIRDAEVQHIPFMLVVGKKEQEQKKVAVRKYQKGDLGQVTLGELVKLFEESLEHPTIKKYFSKEPLEYFMQKAEKLLTE